MFDLLFLILLRRVVVFFFLITVWLYRYGFIHIRVILDVDFVVISLLLSESSMFSRPRECSSYAVLVLCCCVLLPLL